MTQYETKRKPRNAPKLLSQNGLPEMSHNKNMTVTTSPMSCLVALHNVNTARTHCAYLIDTTHTLNKIIATLSAWRGTHCLAVCGSLRE